MNQDWIANLEALRARLQINQYDLDVECVNQPHLYDEVGQMATEARGVARKLKSDLDLVRAETSAKIRKNPEEFVSGKVTEGSIESAIIMDGEYQKALRYYEDAQQVADAFNVLQSAVEQRKSMIKDLVSLFVYSYYSSMQSSGMDKERAANNGDTTLDDITEFRRRKLENQSDDGIPEEEE